HLSTVRTQKRPRLRSQVAEQDAVTMSGASNVGIGSRKKPVGLDGATIREISVEAEADPRTVMRLLRGEEVRGLPARRILRALLALGLGQLAPARASSDKRNCAAKTRHRTRSGVNGL